MAWLLRIDRPKKDYGLSELIYNRSSMLNRRASTKRAAMEMRDYIGNNDSNGHANTSLLTHTSNRDGESTPSLPNSPQLNGTDFKQFRTAVSGFKIYIVLEHSS